MSDSLASLIAAVDAADSAETLLAAIEALAATGDPQAVPTLITALSYNNPGAAVAAVEGLVQIGTPAVPALLEQLDRHNYTARSWAIRALAEIGDARGLTTLLGAATADFAMSVRRGAAKGLGNLQWQQFAPEELEIAQAECLDALLFVCDDEEWVVRYAAVVGLEALAQVLENHPEWKAPIIAKFEQMALAEPVWGVRGRVQLAQQRLAQQLTATDEITAPAETVFSNWQSTLEHLYERKQQERPLAEGDPRRFRSLAAAVAPSTQPDSI
jgi:phycocyanobilin lyase subunit beta